MFQNLKNFIFNVFWPSISDKSVMVLVVPALVVLLLTDQALAKTLIQWSAFSIVLAGISIVVSILVFPQINLTHLVGEARSGSLPSAIVASALVIFFGILFYSLIFWAKA